jgi:hypothetical protein
LSIFNIAGRLATPLGRGQANDGRGPTLRRAAGGMARTIPEEESTVLAKPCPSELTTPINPDRGIEGHRNLFCNFYDACLDEAVKRGWNSWTCTRCALHSEDPEVEGGIESYATQRRMV